MTAVWVAVWALGFAAVGWATALRVRRFPRAVRVTAARQPSDTLFAVMVVADVLSGIGAVALAVRHGPWVLAVWVASSYVARTVPAWIHNLRQA